MQLLLLFINKQYGGFPFINKQEQIRSHCQVVICTVFAELLYAGKRNNCSVLSKYLDRGLFPLLIIDFEFATTPTRLDSELATLTSLYSFQEGTMSPDQPIISQLKCTCHVFLLENLTPTNPTITISKSG